MKSFFKFLIEKKTSRSLAPEHIPHVVTGMKVLHALTGSTVPIDQFVQQGIEHFNNPTTSKTSFKLSGKDPHYGEEYDVELTHPSLKKITDLSITRKKDNKQFTVDLGTAGGYKSFSTLSFGEYGKRLGEFSKKYPIMAGQLGKTIFGATGRQSISARSARQSREDWSQQMQKNLDNLKGEDLVLTDEGHAVSKRKGGFSFRGKQLSPLSDYISGIRLEDRPERRGFHHYISRGRLKKSTSVIDFKQPRSVVDFFRELQHH